MPRQYRALERHVWNVVSNRDGVILSGIDGSSASDIWIVGAQLSGDFTEHFNGTSWSVVPSPSTGINAVVNLSPTSAWTVGANDSQRWNGQTWQPVADRTTIEALAITALSANDIWAVGIYGRLTTNILAGHQSLGRPLVECRCGTGPRLLQFVGGSAALPRGTSTPVPLGTSTALELGAML